MVLPFIGEEFLSSVELHEDSARAQAPNCGIKLRPNQQTLLKKCIELEKEGINVEHCHSSIKKLKTRVGVLADKVGSGKSYVILSLIRGNKFCPPYKKDENEIQVKSSDRYKLMELTMNQKYDFKDINSSILVVPHILKKQWTEYIEKFDPNMTVLVVDTNVKLNKLIQQMRTELDTMVWAEIIMFTDTMYPAFSKIYLHNFVMFDRVIFDEADTNKLVGCMMINSKFTWLVTASWENIACPQEGMYYNPTRDTNTKFNHKGITSKVIKERILELIKEYSKYNVLPQIFVKNDNKFVDSCLGLPPMISITYKCKTPSVINILRGNVSNNVLLHLNAGDEAGAIDCLSPTTIGTMENIIKQIIVDLEVRRDNINIEIEAIQKMTISAEDRNEKIQKLESKKEKILEKENCIKERIRTNEICNICYTDFDGDMIRVCMRCCNQIFCMQCIASWMKSHSTCPMCRKPVIEKYDLLIVDNKGKAKQKVCNKEEVILTKIDQLVRIVQKKHDGPSASTPRKILIFSGYDNSLDNIRERFSRLDIKYDILKGQSSRVNKLCDEFRNSEQDKILLMNSTYCGSGLNLESTTDIVMMHKFLAETEDQIVGRAQRSGRTSQLKLHYLVYDNETDA